MLFAILGCRGSGEDGGGGVRCEGIYCGETK
jgi:hypothetical protein